MPIWALRLVRVAVLVITKGVIEGDTGVLLYGGLPLVSVIVGWTVYVRRTSTMTIDPGGVTVRSSDHFARGVGSHTVPLSAIDGFAVRRWYPPSFWLDLAGPRWVRPSICLSIRLTDGGYVRLPMLTRPRWRMLPGPRILWCEPARRRPGWTIGSRYVARPQWIRRWRVLRDASGRPVRWDRDDDELIVELLSARVSSAAAFDFTSPEHRLTERAPRAPWLISAFGLIDLQDRAWWRAEDGCRGAALSAPLAADDHDGGRGDVAPTAEAPTSWRVVRRTRLGVWRPLRATYRGTVGRSGVTIREWGLAGLFPIDEVEGFELRRWPGNNAHRPSPVPIALAARLKDGRFVEIPGFRVHAGDRRPARVLVRSGVLGRWLPWGGTTESARWDAATATTFAGAMSDELERFRRLGLPPIVRPELIGDIDDGPERGASEEVLGHLIDRRGADGKPARSEPVSAP